MRRISRYVVILSLIVGCSVTPKPSAPSPSLLFVSSPASSRKLIIFVHGIFRIRAPWVNRSGQSWTDLMKEDNRFAGFSLATYRYDSPLRGRTSGIEEVAIRFLRQLEDDSIFEKYDEIYFIAHSMGGLVVKRTLTGLNRPNYIEKLRRVKAVLYISTPAQGADIASVGSYLSVNPQLHDMRPADLNSFIQSLENQWQDLSARSRCSISDLPPIVLCV